MLYRDLVGGIETMLLVLMHFTGNFRDIRDMNIRILKFYLCPV